MKSTPVLIRLSVLPVLATSIVLLISALSLTELSRALFISGEKEDRAPPPGPLMPVSLDNCTTIDDVSDDVPEYTEAKALQELEQRVSRPAVKALWPIEHHRGRLYELLLEPETPVGIRMHLLGAFEGVDPERALAGAREILTEDDLGESPLLLQALNVLAEHGAEGDLEHFAERPREGRQVRIEKERYRAILLRRLR